MSLHKPVFYTRKETHTHVFHNCNGSLDFISSEMVTDREAYLIGLAIEEGKRQKALELAQALGLK